MKRVIRFSDIGQFRNTVQDIIRTAQYQGLDKNNNPIIDTHSKLPTIDFIGTVKLHGQNTGITYDTKTEEIYNQSRKNVITPEKDSGGFSFWASSKNDIFLNLFRTIKSEYHINGLITIYGEWAGKGIQKGVGIAKLPKAYYVFGLKVTPFDLSDERPAYWLNVSNLDLKYLNSEGIYNIYDFKTYHITIDFEHPELVQNKIAQYVKEVEDRCPVASTFLPEDDDLIGEGIVFKGQYKGTIYTFKVKGHKHSKSRVKTLKKLSPEELEKLSKVDKCSEEIFSTERCNQALTEIFGVDFEKDIDIKKMGEYLKWVSKDTIKEEQDIIQKYDLEPKDVIKKVQSKAKNYFLEVYKIK